jgi:hypothetical protein
MMSVMARSKGKGLSVRPDVEQWGKIRAIAYAERRSLNDQILYFIDRGLEVFDRARISLYRIDERLSPV